MTEEKEKQKQKFWSLQGIVVVIVFLFVAWQLYLGLTIEEIGIPELLTIKLRQPPGKGQTVVISQDFIVGRWRVKQNFGQASNETIIDYRPDGTFTGEANGFQGGIGQRQFIQGQWYFDKISDESFQLTISSYNQQPVVSTFKIIDQNKVHNINQNYIAIRE
jgi:hypothetical protein